MTLLDRAHCSPCLYICTCSTEPRLIWCVGTVADSSFPLRTAHHRSLAHLLDLLATNLTDHGSLCPEDLCARYHFPEQQQACAGASSARGSGLPGPFHP